MDTKGLETLLAVALVAALAPMIVAALPGPRIPQVVILILAGILIGPHVLGLAVHAQRQADRQRRTGIPVPARRVRA